MLVPFLIMLREGLEASLIVAIIAGYLKQTGRGAFMPVIWIGVLLAAALALFVGAGLQLVSAEFPQRAQEAFEAVVGLIAVCVLTAMVFWMREAARSIKASLHASIEATFSEPSAKGAGFGLVAMVFLAVAREGLESIFFLLATFQQTAGLAAPTGAALGLVCAALLGWGLYAGGIRLNMRQFFRWTGVFILFVAAGLLATSVRALHEAGLWNHLQETIVDLSAILPADSVVGTILAGLFGYSDAPTASEMIAYVGFLVPALFLFFRPIASQPAAAPLTTVGASR